ncbi:MAG: arginine repressor [Oscillospiraceae bacterium]|nr:arginine repressor [Oscillospiraceae bacterium]
MKSKRHAKIREIIRNQPVDTQEELQQLLQQEGFMVTQATVSRDIKELRLIKALDANGGYRYSTVKLESDTVFTKFNSLFADAVLNVEPAMNIVVVKCLSGMAQAVCAAMDAMNFEKIIGTLAGEDTFFCVTKDEAKAVDLVIELKKLMSR